jgi:type II secretory pathway pseudopilin PulG
VRAKATAAFTLIELLIVISIIIVLAGLVLATSGYVQNKGRRSRAEAEIAALSAALENYRADNGIYPRGNAVASPTDAEPFDTDKLDAKTSGDPASYAAASLFLYKALTGDNDADRSISATETATSYFAFKPNQLEPPTQTSRVAYIGDPFRNSYGYSTAYQYNSATGFNPTFDLWSTGGETGKRTDETFAQYQQRWIKNW